MRNLLIDLLPPLAVRAYLALSGKSQFRGRYRNWLEAGAATTGYDSDDVIDTVRVAAGKVRDGEAVYERDSVLFDKVQYAWPVLAGILWFASRNGNRLNLVDFGGALGSSYYQNLRFLEHLDPLRWSIVEQDKFVAIGKTEFENQHLRFYGDLEECCRQENPDVLLLSSVLQYMEDPYRTLGEAISLDFEGIIIDRTLFFENGPEEIAVQVVPPGIYRASYPAWFLDRRRFLDFISAAYEVSAEFDSLAGTVRIGRRSAKDRGFILTRRRK